MKVLMLGVSGQDGSYLAEHQLAAGNEVYGIIRRQSVVENQQSRIDHLRGKMKIFYGDLLDVSSLQKVLTEVMPDEIYNLAAMSHVRVSFDIPQFVIQTNTLGVLNLLESIRTICPTAKVYQASSCLPAGTKVLVQKEITRQRNGKTQVFKTLGTSNIENLKVDDIVLSYNLQNGKKEYKKIEATGNRLANNMFTLRFSNGNELRLSGNHPVYVHNKGWVRTDELVVNQEVIQKRYNGLSGRIMKGKTNTELHGEEKANVISEKQSISQKNNSFKHPWTNLTLDQIYSKNPEKEQLIRANMSNGQKNSNSEVWNKGLTKDTDERLRKSGKKIGKTHKKLWQDPKHASKILTAFGKVFNKKEEEFFNLLQDVCPNEFEYNGDGRVKVFGSKIPDFINVKGKKKLIEFNGDFWHKDDIPGERLKYFKNYGWELLEIWQSELDSNPDSVKKKVKDYLYNPESEVVTITEIKKHDIEEKVYDIQVKDNHNFFAYGILVHNSEMFGLTVEDDRFQRETTQFNPTSPYGISKVAAYHFMRHYRRAYGMFAVNGILFNHSSVSGFTPIIFKENNEIDIKPISEVVDYHSNKEIKSVNKNLLAHQTIDVTNNFEVWDKNGWVRVTCASAYPHKKEDPKNPSFIISKNSAYFVTDDHGCIMEDSSEKKAKDIEVGSKVSLVEYPKNENIKNKISENEAELLGFIVGAGHYNIKENKTSLANKDIEILDYFANIWVNDLSGTVGKYKAKTDVWQYRLNKNKTWTKQFDIYTKDKYKRIPKTILNSSIEIQKAFLIGYNKADGLKKNPCIYQFKNFRTNSHTLAAGLLYLLNNTTNQRYNINIDYKNIKGKRAYYYSINILSDSDDGQNHQNSYSNYLEVKNLLNDKISQREISRITGISRIFIRKIQNGYIPDNSHHLEKANNEIKKIIPHNDYKDWFYDLETTSGTFHAGVGQGYIHNSPRRGSNFVIAKIVKAACSIKIGLQEKLELGNMDTYRDFGHSKDYCIDLDSKLLTTDGFKRREDLNIGDITINYNTSNNSWGEDKIIKLYDVPYNGNMYTFKGNNINFRCSENHRIVYRRRTNGAKRWNNYKWLESTAKEFYKEFQDKSKREKYNYCFPGFDGLHQDKKDYIIDDNMIILMGYLVTEGCLSISKTIGGGSQLSVSQSKKKYYRDLKNVIDNLNLSYREKERPGEVVEFIFHKESRDLVLDYFENLDIHKLPSYIFNFSKSQLELLYVSMMNGDGAWANNTYYSMRKKLAEDLQTIASIIGYKTSLKKQKSGVYVVTMFSHAKNSVNNFIQKIELDETSENIWCVETEKNKTIISKKNDSIFISGNCNAMMMIMNHSEPDDFVISSMETYSIRDVCKVAFNYLGMNYEDYVVQNPKYMRPEELPYLKGDSTKARKILKWKPEYNFESLVKEMVDHWLDILQGKKSNR